MFILISDLCSPPLCSRQSDLLRSLGWLDKYEEDRLPLVRVTDLLPRLERLRARMRETIQTSLGTTKPGTGGADRRSKGT